MVSDGDGGVYDSTVIRTERYYRFVVREVAADTGVVLVSLI